MFYSIIMTASAVLRAGGNEGACALGQYVKKYNKRLF